MKKEFDKPLAWSVPIGSSQIGKAEVAWCVRGELLHTRAIGKLRNPLGPSRDRKRLS